jgi:uncharacterized protein YndB with AHSA1/START domain
MQRTITHHYAFPQPPVVVWEYLTDSELMAQWLMPNDFKPIRGHTFQFKTKPLPLFGFDGIVRCEVLEIVAGEKLVYSWKSGSLDTVVEWTLTPDGNGTKLTLQHKGFNGLKNLIPFTAMKPGWLKIGRKLFSLLNS